MNLLMFIVYVLLSINNLWVQRIKLIEKKIYFIKYFLLFRCSELEEKKQFHFVRF